MLIVLLLQWQDKWKLFIPPYISSIINATPSFKNMCLLCLDYLGMLNTINYKLWRAGLSCLECHPVHQKVVGSPSEVSAALSPLSLCLSNFRCLSASWEYHLSNSWSLLSASWALPPFSLCWMQEGSRVTHGAHLFCFLSLCGSLFFFFYRLIFSVLGTTISYRLFFVVSGKR